MLHVVVIGGGPAGLVAAETLAKAGLKATLVERKPGRVLPCAGLVSSQFLQEFGVPEHLASQRVSEVAVFSPTSRVAFLSLTGAERGAHVMARELLQAVLRRRAEDAGVSFVTGNFVRFRHGEGDYPLVEVELPGRKREQIACDVVVGADGAHSRVARALGLPAAELGVAYMERLSYPNGQPPAGQEAMHVHFGRKVSTDYFGWMLPQGDHLQLGVTTHVRYGKRVWDMLAELKKRLGNHLDGTRAVSREAFCFPLKPREKLVHDRVLLVGDAAGLVASATRDSLYYACKSGQLAAETIIRHQHVPVPEKLADYQRAWAQTFGPVFAGSGKLEQLLYASDRRREAIVDLAWDREVQKAAVESYLSKKPLGSSLKLRLRLQPKLAALLLKYSMINPKRLDGDPVNRVLPASENYLELALKSQSGPLRALPELPAGPLPDLGPVPTVHAVRSVPAEHEASTAPAESPLVAPSES